MFLYEYQVRYDFDDFSVVVPVSLRADGLGGDWSVRADEIAREVLDRDGFVFPELPFVLDTDLLQVSGGY